MRLFLALNIPDDVRSAIHTACAPLRTAINDASWAAPDRLHLTLKFLGEASDVAAAAVAAAVRPIAARYRAMALRMGGIGVFPNFRHPRIVWIGVEADPKLELLQHDLELACATLGHPVEGRPFRPHVTLGRIADAGSVFDGRALARAAEAIEFECEATVDGVDAMRSDRGPGGTRYSVVGSAPFSIT
ncbi:MAG: hypothetical protein NVS4B3_00590 [Gemmatimonadaceae bacterium]